MHLWQKGFDVVALHREDLHLKWLCVTRDCEREAMLTSASWCRRWCESFAHWVPPQTSSSEIWTWDERDRITDLNMRHGKSVISCDAVFFVCVCVAPCSPFPSLKVVLPHWNILKEESDCSSTNNYTSVDKCVCVCDWKTESTAVY